MSQVIQHGVCLSLGLAALGTGDNEVYDELKNLLAKESVVAGEDKVYDELKNGHESVVAGDAAGIGIGLLMVGTKNDEAKKLLEYAHKITHEKTKR